MKTGSLPFRNRPGQRSAALVIVLLFLALLSVLVLSLLVSTRLEHSISQADYQSQVASALSTTGLNSAVAQIRTALGPWDDPYKNFCDISGTTPSFFWSVSPGLITRWPYDSTAASAKYALFSQATQYADGEHETNTFNLNAPLGDGTTPIIGGPNAAAVPVAWENVLQNPSNTTPAKTNQIIGRFAFWVDDESAKININTADGTMKYQTTSLGLGTPSEVSLTALNQGGAPIPTPLATNIVYIARTTGFNSPQEILRATGTTTDLLTNNIFNITCSSRSPDLNIFGQPKMAVLPVLGDSSIFVNDMVLNGLTLQPLTEIYPTPSQLPLYTAIAPAYSQTNSVDWPLAFRQLHPNGNEWFIRVLGGGDQAHDETCPNYPYVNGMMLANYLAGKDAMRRNIKWPPFPGTSAPSTGFAGKYTNRQIDSIIAQICSLGSKTISPDDYSTAAQGPDYNLRIGTTPFLWSGWLSNQRVNGLGRTPKVTQFLMSVQTFAAMGTDPADPSYVPPRAYIDMWLEWWLPAGFLGGNPQAVTYPASPYNMGWVENPGLNSADLSSSQNSWRGGNLPAPQYTWLSGMMPRADGSNNYWSHQLLTNNQGMDFAGNPHSRVDPDQHSASIYHQPYEWNSTNNAYMGSGAQFLGANASGNGDSFTGPFHLVPMANQGDLDWVPGEMKSLHSIWGSGAAAIPMQLSGATTPLVIGGGISVNSYCNDSYMGDMDPTPLETVRGVDINGAAIEQFDNESWTNHDDPFNPSPGSPPGTTVRDRVVASVIPVSITIPAPPTGGVLGNVAYAWASVKDPLVNKFPGDWTTTSGGSLPTTTMVASDSTTSYNSYSEYDAFHGNLTDPDSYWLPQADCTLAVGTDLAAKTLIPRTARMPNIGYLQYIRTGIIPDDESVPYATQKGTPFRLLSYAPSNDSADQQTTRSGSQTYPDWAMLDLLYVPSILAPYGGPYGYYDPSPSTNWHGYGNPAILKHYSTYGGATPGRVNPNGALLYTTSTDTPLTNSAGATVMRTVPLTAVVQGIMVNQHLTPVSLADSETAGHANPGYMGGNSVDATSIAGAIANYIATSGPMRLPEEICNVPAINSWKAPVNSTRNDLVRQILGELTTQSNVFSVWTVGEAIKKIPGNTNYGLFESGDVVLAVSRSHYIVERYLDPGTDGVYGNSLTPGTDGVSGTYDDPLDSVKHPYCPHYLYRVISAEEIR